MTADEMRTAVSTRISVALWMAIGALETEAEALRILAGRERGLDGSSEGELAAHALRAENDARMLRELASAHVPSDRPSGARDDV